jgi:hypothetical protein
MSQSEEDILTALIVAQVTAVYQDKYDNRYTVRAGEASARACAKKILSCGFSMASRPVDDLQDKDIEDLQIQVEQLRGWSGLPPELRR